jgi:hypothetical protein
VPATILGRAEGPTLEIAGMLAVSVEELVQAHGDPLPHLMGS